MQDHPPQPVDISLLYPSRKMQARRVRDLVDDIHGVVRQHLLQELAHLNEQI